MSTPSTGPTHITRHIVPTATTGTERSAGRAPSTDSEVSIFLDVLAHDVGRLPTDTTLGAAPFIVVAYDTASNGKLIPIAIAARPRVLSAREAHATGRPVVFVEAGAQSDAGDGSDAVLATLRDLLGHDSTTATALDSIVLVAVPRARPATTPPTVAAPDTDLILGAAPETRTTFAIFHTWQPDLVIDLQSSDLGDAAHEIVLAPPLTPAALLAAPFTSDTLIPPLRHQLSARHVETAPCGTTSCDHRMRALTNYAGLRNRPALVIRANAALPLTRRVAALQIALHETVSLVARQRTELLSSITTADSTIEAWGQDPGASPGVPLRAAPTAIRRPPLGYVLPPDDSATARLLIRHGIVIQHHPGPLRVQIIERFMIDSLTDPPARFTGHWLRVIADTTLPAGSYVVPGGQPLDLLTMQLLEPESDDGLAAAHVYDQALHKGASYPVIRLLD